MRITAVLVAALLFAPLAYAGTIDAGSTSCSLSECPGFIEKRAKAQYQAMDYTNCTGHGHVKGPGFCNLYVGAKVYVELRVAGQREDWWFEARQIGANFDLLPTLPPPQAQTFRVYYQQFCIGIYVDTDTYAQASSVEGGVTYTIFYPPADPDPGLCWDVAVEGSH